MAFPWLKTGEGPPNKGKQRKPLADKFWDSVHKTSSDECWLWTASCFSNGYGQIYNPGATRKAHRVSWELHHGPIPDGMDVLHSCDNPPCVNPSHLFLGTHQDNMADRDRKGRGAAGSKHPLTKLTTAQVLEIRELCASQTVQQKELALRFGVSRSQICQIAHEKTWKCLFKKTAA